MLVFLINYKLVSGALSLKKTKEKLSGMLTPIISAVREQAESACGNMS